MSERRIRIVLLSLGVLGVANAAWMLLDAHGWFVDLPAAVPDFGPFNHHLVQDLGSAYLATGVGIVWAAYRPSLRFALVLVAAIFYVAHALVHVRDTASGFVTARHWAIDVPGVYLPAAVLTALALYVRRRPVVARPAEPTESERLDAAIRDLEE